MRERLQELKAAARREGARAPHAGSVALMSSFSSGALRHAAETAGSFNKMDHLGGGMNRQRMLRKARPRTNVVGHLADQVELPIGCLCKQCDYEVFECDHANAELHQLDICQRRDCVLDVAETRALERAVRTGAALVLPPREAM